VSFTKTIRFFQLGLLAGLVAVSSVQPAFAAEQPAAPKTESILLSPSVKRYDFDAGTSRRDSFDILNDGQTAFTFVVYARPYTVKNETYEPDFINGAENSDAYKWVQFDQPSYSIEPGQTVKVNYTVRVPSGAAPGGHYGILFAETQPSSTTTGTSIIRKKRVGAIVYAQVKGAVRTSGKLESTDVPFFQFLAPLKARSTVSNAGNTDFAVKSAVEVRDVFGSLKYGNSKEVSILPSKPREINNDWQNPAWVGLYKVEQTNQFLDTSKTSSGYVLLVPLWVYLVLALLISGRMLYAVLLRRRKK
jgi:hypothetical protein